MRIYRYIGPPEVLAAARHLRPGQKVLAAEDITEADEPFTFVIDSDGDLRLAERRSEHAACAGGAPVLSAGEISFERGRDGWAVTSVSNQSTGYCPEPSSWPAVVRALDRLGVSHPEHFTHEFTFRRCPACGERNLVRDEDFTCALCDAELPVTWNFGETLNPLAVRPAGTRMVMCEIPE